jgi:serine-type D-Ala-D-Ala carboxypeptidase/endopeptidase (penicillin-binding protein 4)
MNRATCNIAFASGCKSRRSAGYVHRLGRMAGVAVLLAAAGCARTGVPAAPQPRPYDFAHLADSIIATPPLDRAHFGVMVYDPATQRTVYEHNADRRFVPASNQKYWPTSTALHELGADYRYRTPVLGIGVDAVAASACAVVVVGRGDPTLSNRFLDDDHTALELLADSIAAAGVRHITGDLIIDASWFDSAIIPGTWTYGNLNSTSAPPTGAFAVAEGLFRVTIEPGAAVGAPATVHVIAPVGTVPLLSSVMTAPAGATTTTSVARGPWNDTLRISGAIAHGAEARSLRIPMADPVRFAGRVLADALRARGVTITGDVRIVADSTEAARVRSGDIGAGAAASTGVVGAAGSGGARAVAGRGGESARTGGAGCAVTPLPVRELAAWMSPPMRDIVAAINKPSQNWIAEQLVRTLGAEKGGEGSWRAGVQVQNRFLFDTVGIDSAALRLQDGSGMSHQNLVTPRAIVQLLDYARTAQWGATFRESLAVPGQPGTLSSRLTHLQDRLAGKTGTLSNVNALSGYVTTRDGRELIFVIIGNASGLPGAPVVAAMNMMVNMLADGTPVVTAPAPPRPAVPLDMPPNVITNAQWRTTPPLGHAADANRRNVPAGELFEFRDLSLTVLSTTVDSSRSAAPVNTVRLRLVRGTAAEERTVSDGAAFQWNGYRVAVVAIYGPGQLGAGLVALEVATLESLPAVVRNSAVAGGAELRLRVPHEITRVTLHHTGFPEPLRPDEDPVLRLRNLQSWGATDRNWWDVPYHFLIDLEGRIYEGRDWRYKGDTNTTYEPGGHFLISLLGNYEIQEPTAAQIEAVADLMAWAVMRFDLPLDSIGGHYDYATTSCPGVYLRGMLEDGTFRRLVAGRTWHQLLETAQPNITAPRTR